MSRPRLQAIVNAFPDLPGSVVAWLMLNRDGFDDPPRPETGNDLRDHGVHAVWFGAVLPLRLEAFQQQGETV